jgi:type IV fimbrial biogenesis protein FimT
MKHRPHPFLRPRAWSNSGNAGWSLVELLVVLGMVTSLLAVGTGALRGLRLRVQVQQEAWSMYQSLIQAQHTARMRQQLMVLCASADGLTCASGTGAGWSIGRMLFEDRNSDGVRQADETMLAATGPMRKGVSVAGSSTVARRIAYASNGRSQQASGAFLAGTLVFCQALSQGVGHQIVINALGKPRLEWSKPGVCAQGIA